jgi:hypothetical protein
MLAAGSSSLASTLATAPTEATAATPSSEQVALWRDRVAAARRAAIWHAHRVGIQPANVAYENRTRSIAYLEWLQQRWQFRSHAWMRQFRLLAPKLLCIHSDEGAWNAYNPADFYGGLQMDRTFMQTYGWDKLVRYGWRDARYWSPADQLAVAMRAVRARGFTPWPNTAAACGLL